MILNNTTELVTSTPLATATILGGLFGDQINYHNHHTICVFPQSLTDAQMKDVSRTLQAAIIPAAGTKDTLLVTLGDSRTAGQGSVDNLNVIAQLLPTLANPTRYKSYNCAESGQPIAAQYANRALLDKLVADNPTLSRKILIINNDGINDDRGSTLATTTLANHRNLAAYAQGLGFYVISTTCAADGSTLGLANKAITDARNTSLNADHTAFNAFYDLSSQTYATNTADTAFYTPDKLHHTNAFYALNAAALKPLVDAAFIPNSLANYLYGFDTTNTTTTPAISGECQTLVDLYTPAKFIGAPAGFAPSIITTGGVGGNKRVLTFASAQSEFLDTVFGATSPMASTASVWNASDVAASTGYFCWAGKVNATATDQYIWEWANSAGTQVLQVRSSATDFGVSLKPASGVLQIIAVPAASQDTAWHVFELYLSSGTLTLTQEGVTVISAPITGGSALSLDRWGAGLIYPLAANLNGALGPGIQAGSVPPALLRLSARQWVAAPMGITTA
jgi:hypothetical protein